MAQAFLFIVYENLLSDTRYVEAAFANVLAIALGKKYFKWR